MADGLGRARLDQTRHSGADHGRAQEQEAEAPRGGEPAPEGAAAKASAGQASDKPPPGDKSREDNPLRTVVLVEKIAGGNGSVAYSDTSVTYKESTMDVTEVRTREQGHMDFKCHQSHDIKTMVSTGYNAALLSLEAPNTAQLFSSPVWPIFLSAGCHILTEHTQENGELHPQFEMSFTLAFISNGQMMDLLGKESATFQPVRFVPSPIFGPRIGPSTSERIYSASAFEDFLSTMLSRGAENKALIGMENGFIFGSLLVRQLSELDGTPDAVLSSLQVLSAGSSVEVYEEGLDRKNAEYAGMFNFIFGGPCITCVMLNLADDDRVRHESTHESRPSAERIERMMAFTARAASRLNYPLRVGSVRRFYNVVLMSYAQGVERLNQTEDENSRQKLQGYINDQKRLVLRAKKMLEQAGIDEPDPFGEQ